DTISARAVSHRGAPGHARHDRSSIARLGAAPRLRPRAAHSIELSRGDPGRRRLALSGAPPARATGRDRGGMDRLGKPPTRAYLPAHSRRPQTSRRGAFALGADLARHLRSLRPTDRGGSMSFSWRNPWRSRRVRESELEREIHSHLQMDIAERVSRGESPGDAARNAARDFGSRATVREVTTDMWSGEALHRVMQDARYAIRSLVRAPGFTVVAVLTLALGIGANTAIFSVLNGVLLRPLPYPKPDQLIYITSQFPKLGFDQFPMDAAEFLEFRERNQSFQAVGAYSAGAVNVGADAAPQRVTSAIVSSSLFKALGVAPMRGNVFTEDETLPNAAPVAVLSRELWESAFGGRSIVGQQIDVDGVKRTVVGIMPAGFDVHDQGVRIWLPLTLDPSQRQQYRGGHFLLLVGRLKDGVTLRRARGELETLLTQWIAADGGTPGAAFGQPGAIHAPDPKNHRLRYDGLQADMIGSVGRALWILQVAVGFVLLIACANLANLLLMRAESR